MNREYVDRHTVQYYQGVTSSGLRTVFFPTPGFAKKYAFLAVDFGGSDLTLLTDEAKTELPPGTAHYLEHMMFRMPGYDAMDRLSEMGADSNAWTSTDTTAYLFSTADRFEESLRELLLFVGTPCFEQLFTDSERQVITQEIRRSADQPGALVRNSLMKLLFRNSTAREPVLGSEESIAAITPEVLNRAHSLRYRPAGMILCCAGDLEPEAVFETAEQSGIGGETGVLAGFPEESDTGLLPDRIREELSGSVSMPLFLMGAKTSVRTGQERFRDGIVADLAAELFIGEGSPLFMELYERNLISAGFSSGVYEFRSQSVFSAGGRSADPSEVFARIADAAAEWKPDKRLKERLKNAARAMTGNFLMSLDSAENLCHTHADGVFGGFDPYREPETAASVSVEEVCDYIRSNLAPERLALSVIRPDDTERN